MSASSPRRIESDRAAEVARERAGRGGVGVLETRSILWD